MLNSKFQCWFFIAINSFIILFCVFYILLHQHRIAGLIPIGLSTYSALMSITILRRTKKQSNKCGPNTPGAVSSDDGDYYLPQ